MAKLDFPSIYELRKRISKDEHKHVMKQIKMRESVGSSKSKALKSKKISK